jgi:hypothetical protein
VVTFTSRVRRWSSMVRISTWRGEGRRHVERSFKDNTGSFFHESETMREDKPSQQLYRTAALHELWGISLNNLTKP